MPSWRSRAQRLWPVGTSGTRLFCPIAQVHHGMSCWIAVALYPCNGLHSFICGCVDPRCCTIGIENPDHFAGVTLVTKIKGEFNRTWQWSQSLRCVFICHTFPLLPRDTRVKVVSLTNPRLALIGRTEWRGRHPFCDQVSDRARA